MKKIFISTTSFGEYDDMPLDLCRQEGFEVVLNPYGRKIKESELIELAKGAQGLVAGTEVLTDETLSKLLPDLKVVSRCGAGIENVDIDAAKRFGIKVFNTPDAPTLAVAELTVGLILDLLRKISLSDRNVRSGEWKKTMGNLLTGKNVGLIGFGRIGRKVAALLKGLGCFIAYYDPFVKDKLANFIPMSKDEALKWADIVSIHASSKDKIMTAREFNLMKRGSFFLNVSRGEVIDEKALYEKLECGHLTGAALDVFEEEPYSGPLRDLQNVILTPHIGSYAKEARMAMEREAVENLLRGLREG